MSLQNIQVILILAALVIKDNNKTQYDFECVSCGYQYNADVAGALNMLRVRHNRSIWKVNEGVYTAAETH